MSGVNELLYGFGCIFPSICALTAGAGRAGAGSTKSLTILCEVCLGGLLSGWQENGIACHSQHLMSLCVAASCSVGASETAQVKPSEREEDKLQSQLGGAALC